MADNLAIKDAAGDTQTMRTTDNAGVHTAHHIVSSSALPSGAATSAKQDTIITALADLLTELGQKLEGGGTVVIDAASLSTLTTALETIELGATTLAALETLTVTANAGTNLDTSGLATEAGGNLASAATSLAVMDDWDESDRAKVNLIVGQAGVAAGAGAVSVATQRVIIATDQTAVAVAPQQITSTTGTPTFVNDTTTEAQVLASNTSRVRATFMNTSSAVCYLLLGTGTAGPTACTVRLSQWDIWVEEGEGVYTGAVRADWASDPGDGGLAIVEYT